jgi:hypothetical protein
MMHTHSISLYTAGDGFRMVLSSVSSLFVNFYSFATARLSIGIASSNYLWHSSYISPAVAFV